MANPTRRVATADTEAAAWHARLGARSVSTETLEAFFAWRETPGNAEAYKRVETVWAKTGKLSADPAMTAALAAAAARGDRRRAQRPVPRSLIALAACSIAAAFLLGGWAWLQTRSEFSTQVGQQQVVQLADGSSVRLNTDSRVRVRFTQDVRRIELLRGQAQFSVAHDKGRPFVVEAGTTRVTAVGTVFDVRRDASDVRVTLLSGVVDVAQPAVRQPTRMSAGRQAAVTQQGVTMRPVDVQREASWTEGRIVFRDTPLAQAVAEVNRYLTDPVILEAGGTDATPVNGVFKIGDREAFVSAAAGALDLKATQRRDGSVLLSGRTK